MRKKEAPLQLDYRFDSNIPARVVRWVQQFCTHPIGDLQGKPLILPEWFVKDMIYPFFGTLKPDGYRKYQEVYMEVGSGNAKSTIGAALALYLLAGDKQMSPRGFCLAGSKNQAGIIFDSAKIMVKQNETLSEHLEILRNSISVENEYGLGILAALTADSDMEEGKNPTFIIMDETHVQRNGNLYHNLKKNFAKRKQPCMIELTTAGTIFTFGHELAENARAVKAGKLKEPGLLPLIYAADPDGDDFDMEQIKMANPGIDYLNMDVLLQDLAKAKKSASYLAAWRRYRLNKWTGATITWMPDIIWMKGTECADHSDEALREYRNKHLSIAAMKGRPCYMGLDFSASRDTTCCALIFPPITPGERVKVIPRIYIPSLTLQDRIDSETGQYGEWKTYGDIIMTPKMRQDYDAIYSDIEYLLENLNVICVGYDRWNADQIISKLESRGIECKAYKQDYPEMNTPMKKLDSMVTEGEFEHGGQPALRWQCSNLQARFRTIGGSEYMMPTKSSDKARIDAMVATIIATGVWIWKQKEIEEQEKSIVKTKGMVNIKLTSR